MAELKPPQLQYYSNFGVPGPAAVAGRGAAVQAALATASADFKDLLAKSYLQPGTAAGDAFVKQVQDEYASNARVIKEGGIKAE